MSLSKVREIVVNHKGLILAGAALLILSVWLLIPAQPDPEKLQALLERGNYQAVREGAEQALAREPEEHAVRELLVQAYVAEGRFAEAMEHVLFLAGYEQDMAKLEILFTGALPSIAGEQEECSAMLTLLSAELDKHAQWDWLKEFGLKALTEGHAVSITPDYLASLCYEDLEKYPGLVNAVWIKAVESGDWDAAWRTAKAIDRLVGDNWQEMAESNAPWQVPRIVGDSVSWEQGVSPKYIYQAGLVLTRFGPDAEKWTALQAAYPQDPLLAIGRGKLDLDWLVEWESANLVGEDYASVYSALKAQLIAWADSVGPEHFANITRWHLLGAGLRDADNKRKLSLVLDYLSSYADLAEDIAAARLALDLPEPRWIIKNLAGGSFAAAGNGLLLYELASDEQNGSGYTYTYYDLETGGKFVLPQGNYHWSPDGAHVAVSSWDSGEPLRIYSTGGELVGEVPWDDDIALHGWRDSDSLWVTKRELEYLVGNVNYLYILDLPDGSLQKVSALPSLPDSISYWVGPNGQVVWNDGRELWIGPNGRVAWNEDRELKIYHGTEVAALAWEGSYIRVRSWSPDGRSLILVVDGKDYYYRVGGSLEQLELLGSSYYNPWSWLNNEEFTWSFPIGGERMLGIYNIKTGQVNMTGIVNPVDVAGDRVLVYKEDGLYIYQLE